MLHEIFKGMDNASEAINDNFLNGGVVDSGSNENGHYFVFGSGLQICFPNARIPVNYYNASTLRAEWNLPRSFATNTFVCLPNAYAFDGSTEVFNNNSSKVTINAIAYGRTLSSSDSTTALPIAVGMATV